MREMVIEEASKLPVNVPKTLEDNDRLVDTIIEMVITHNPSANTDMIYIA